MDDTIIENRQFKRPFDQKEMDKILDRIADGKSLSMDYVSHLNLSDDGLDRLSDFLKKRGYVFTRHSLYKKD